MSLTRNPVVRTSILLVWVGSVVLAGASGLLYRDVERLRADRSLLAQRDELTRAFERLLLDLRATEADRAAVRTLRPDPKNLVRFVEGLEGAAARAFIDQIIAAIPPAADAGGQPYASPVVRYRITLHGTGEKLEQYLRELERLPELVRIERLEARTTPDGHVFTNAAIDLTVAVAVRSAP